MNITEIENMPAAEIKERRDELVAALGGTELASRYVQARLDSKRFDVNAADYAKRCEAMGKEILEWQKNVAALNELIGVERQKAADELAAVRDSAAAASHQHVLDLAAANSKALEVAEQLKVSQARVAELEQIMERKNASLRAFLES